MKQKDRKIGLDKYDRLFAVIRKAIDIMDEECGYCETRKSCRSCPLKGDVFSCISPLHPYDIMTGSLYLASDAAQAMRSRIKKDIKKHERTIRTA